MNHGNRNGKKKKNTYGRSGVRTTLIRDGCSRKLLLLLPLQVPQVLSESRKLAYAASTPGNNEGARHKTALPILHIA
jgi:hypothetical protein